MIKLKHLKIYESFNEGLFANIKKGVSNSYNFYKLVKMLRGWESKYKPEQYDKVISDAFDLINSYNLQPGKMSPPFTLPDEQLEEEFIKKFFVAAEYNGYKVISNPSEREGYTTFNFIRNQQKEPMITKLKGSIVPVSIPITNNRNVLQWIVDCQTSSYIERKKSLSKSLITELTGLFGSPNKSIRLEYNNKVWILGFKGLVFNVFSADGGGTSIEIADLSLDRLRSGDDEETIIEFLEELHRMVNSI